MPNFSVALAGSGVVHEHVNEQILYRHQKRHLRRGSYPSSNLRGFRGIWKWAVRNPVPLVPKLRPLIWMCIDEESFEKDDWPEGAGPE